MVHINNSKKNQHVQQQWIIASGINGKMFINSTKDFTFKLENNMSKMVKLDKIQKEDNSMSIKCKKSKSAEWICYNY